MTVLVATLALLCAAPSASDLAARAHAALVARCAECHAPDSTDAKARRRFDFAADLERVANSDYVVPMEPALSELWVEIDGGTMPPDDAPTGPITAEERDAIHAWIAAGMPLASEVAVADGAAPVGAGASDVGADSARTDGPTPSARTEPTVLEWIGRFHPLSVHFPIAFVFGAALLEALFVLRGGAGLLLRPAVLVLARLGALCAPPVALLGWWNASGSAESDELELHRWLGVASAALAIVVWIAAERTADGNRRWLRAALAVAAAVLGAAGHYGGILVFGDDYLPF